MGRIYKRNIAVILVVAFMLSLFEPAGIGLAKSKPKLSKKTVHIKEQEKRTIRVSCSVKGTIKVKSLNPSFVSAKRKKKKIKKGHPASLVVKGLCPGYAIIDVAVKLKKPIKKEKNYNLRLNVYVDEPEPVVTPVPDSTASPVVSAGVSPAASASASPTVKPSTSPTVRPSGSPSAAPTVSPTKSPAASPSGSPKPVTSATPKPSPTVTPTPTPDPLNYTVTYTHNLESSAPVTGMPNPLVVKIPKSGDCKLTLPAAPKCEGYLFDSWIYKNDYRYNPGKEVVVDGDMTIKARFTRVTGAIVSYLPGDAGYENIRGLPDGIALGTSSSLTISKTEPTWTGHTFSGWCVEGYYDIRYLPGATITGISSNMNLVAQWDRTDGTVVSLTDTPSMLPDVQAVYERLMAQKADYPEGSEFSPDREYKLYGGRTISTGRGGQAFCYILFDAAFESAGTLSDAKPYTYISFLSTEGYVGKIGDIISYNVAETGWDYKDAVIVGTDGDDYTVAEANDGVVHWNTKVSKSKKLEGVYTRWG